MPDADEAAVVIAECQTGIFKIDWADEKCLFFSEFSTMVTVEGEEIRAVMVNHVDFLLHRR